MEALASLLGLALLHLWFGAKRNLFEHPAYHSPTASISCAASSLCAIRQRSQLQNGALLKATW